jgi:RND family efflux transporter MFP subunit
MIGFSTYSTLLPRMTSRRALVFVPLALAALTGCDEAKDSPALPPRPVLTMVVAGAADDMLTLAGTIEPRYRADLSFRVVGRIMQRDVEVGDVVKKGQRVAALDPTALQLAVRSQRAALSNAEASLANAAAIEARQKTLRDRNVTPAATFEAAEQTRIASEAEVERTRSNLTKVEEQLSYAELRSDFDGVVTARSAEVGQVVTVGQTIVTVARPDVREAVVDIPEAVTGMVRPGTAFDVALQLDERIRVTGTLREIAPEADGATRSRRARITLDSPPDTFRLGTTVTVRIKAGSSVSAVRLPTSAVLERDGSALVFVVDETKGTIAELPVSVVGRSDGYVTVGGALRPGSRVVTAGVKSLAAGEPIRLDVGATR